MLNHKWTIIVPMNRVAPPNPVRGPDGSILTIADLPPADTKRWVIRRKATVAAGVRGGLISFEMACSRYRLDPEELLSWLYYIDRYGFLGLRTTKVQCYVRSSQHKCGSSRASYNVAQSIVNST
jgi:hypothetical protein